MKNRESNKNSIEALYQLYLNSTGVCTDTRKLQKGNIYFALKGENFDGNKFAADALGEGALAAVVDGAITREGEDERYYKVNDSLKSLQNLAVYHREKLDIPVIGITGSNGKTTTKELLHAVLSQKYNTYATKGNFNNHIGVPLTILDIKQDVEVAIVEMGANHLGEIAFLSNICNPSHGLITNIGKAHLEGFGGYENIKKGKSELYRYIHEKGGVVFIQPNDKTLNDLIHPEQEVYKAIDLADFRTLESFPFLKFTYLDHELTTKLTGAYNIFNIAVTLSIGLYFDVDLDKAMQAIESYTPTNNRSQVKVIDGTTYILDSYNANPSSMVESIENMVLGDPEKTILILGDMKELGDSELHEHKNLVRFVAKYQWKKVYLVGNIFSSVTDLEGPFSTFNDVFSLKSYLQKNPLNAEKVLLKASRSIALENLID